ncbi:hypothetical protein E2C01_100964 [Portunus trituberculatus]|uniref:Uncharacterized protein n=1 Tax=Portunus trituberculatus TaxID=210409 RepID=A0A5B7K9E1_PORTR|nr:hypothetical protein [Portunus trituberculatus]
MTAGARQRQSILGRHC